MIQSNEEAFDEICRKFEAHDDAQALQELRDLLGRVDDPWDVAWLNYQEILMLLGTRNASEARQRLEDLKRMSACLANASVPSGAREPDARVALPILVRHAEIRVAVAEGKDAEALALIEDFVSRYPSQLASPDFKAVREDVTTVRGIVLADAGRWEEARPLLEGISPLGERKGEHSYYLGRCYYASKQYDQAKDELTRALNAGLRPPAEGAAHYILGLVQYHLTDMQAAKTQFELSLKTAGPDYLGPEIWGWLEATSRALGLQAEAENYRKLKTDLISQAKTN